MFELFAVSIALVGSSIAGIWDLYTTEVPDEVPALMLLFGIFTWYMYAINIGDITPLYLSLSVGTIVLVIGLILYRAGQWGGADAWLLAAIGYLIPLYNGQVFMISFIFNFLIVGSIYMVIYALVLGIINKGIFSCLADDIKKNHRHIAGILFVSYLVIALFYIYTSGVVGIIPTIEVLLLLTLLVFFWRYAKIIESNVFRKKISASKVKVGDVLEEMLWRGITEDEVRQIRKSKKTIVIKEGVRFIPVFPITLVVTMLFGNLFFLLL